MTNPSRPKFNSMQFKSGRAKKVVPNQEPNPFINVQNVNPCISQNKQLLKNLSHFHLQEQQRTTEERGAQALLHALQRRQTSKEYQPALSPDVRLRNRPLPSQTQDSSTGGSLSPPRSVRHLLEFEGREPTRTKANKLQAGKVKVGKGLQRRLANEREMILRGLGVPESS